VDEDDAEEDEEESLELLLASNLFFQNPIQRLTSLRDAWMGRGSTGRLG